MFHQVDHGAHDLVASEGNVDAVNAGGVDEALHVFGGAENRGPSRQRVAANAFKHRRAVVHDVRHHVEGSVVPGDELAVVPDFVRLLNGHADSLRYRIRASELGILRMITWSKKTSSSRMEL